MCVGGGGGACGPTCVCTRARPSSQKVLLNGSPVTQLIKCHTCACDAEINNSAKTPATNESVIAIASVSVVKNADSRFSIFFFFFFFFFFLLLEITTEGRNKRIRRLEQNHGQNRSTEKKTKRRESK